MDILSLESRIKAEVYNFSGEIGLYANDFKGNIIEVNSNEKFEAASTIKVFVLAELYRQIHEKKMNINDILKYDEKNYIDGSGVLKSLDFGVEMTAKNIATLMIIVSDNVATNMLIEHLGVDNINNTCRELGFNDTILHNKIDFEKYDKLGTTTPKDYGKFYEKLYKEELWSQELSKEMLEIFKKQHYNTIMTKNLPHYYFDSDNTGEEEFIYVASKTGSMNSCRNDGGIVHTPYGGYVLTILTKDFVDKLYYNDHESYRFGANVSKLMFDQYIGLKGTFR